MNDKDKIKIIVANNINRYFPELNSMDVNIRVVSHKSTFIPLAYSERFYCQLKIREKSGQLINKAIYIKKTDNPQWEYEKLKTVADLYTANKVELGVPQPLDYQENYFLVEYIHGINFLIYLLKKLLPGVRSLRIDDIKRKFATCGRWLANFQNLCHSDEVKNWDSKLTKIYKRLEKITIFSKSQKLSITKALEKCYDEFPETPILLSGDFVPRNCLFTYDSTLKVVDWDEYSIEDQYYDLCAFLTNIQSRTKHKLYSIDFIDMLEQVLWDEYTKHSQYPANKRLFQFSRILYLIDYIYDYQYKIRIFKTKPRSTKSMNNFIEFIIGRYFTYETS